MMRVFEGGEGCVRGGRVERSRERGVGVLCVGGLAEGEVGGEVWGAGMVAVGGKTDCVGTIVIDEDESELRNGFCRPRDGEPSRR